MTEIFAYTIYGVIALTVAVTMTAWVRLDSIKTDLSDDPAGDTIIGIGVGILWPLALAVGVLAGLVWFIQTTAGLLIRRRLRKIETPRRIAELQRDLGIGDDT